MLHGSINHIAITVADLPKAMEFFGPLLGFLGYTPEGLVTTIARATTCR